MFYRGHLGLHANVMIRCYVHAGPNSEVWYQPRSSALYYRYPDVAVRLGTGSTGTTCCAHTYFMNYGETAVTWFHTVQRACKGLERDSKRKLAQTRVTKICRLVRTMDTVSKSHLQFFITLLSLHICLETSPG